MLRYLSIFLFMIAGYSSALAQPAFKGGSSGLDAFLQSKIIYPEFSSQNCIAATIHVSFMIQKDGRVTDARVQQGPGIDLDDEALRVIKLTSGKWNIPADYNRAVRVVLPVRFRPDYERCQKASNSANPPMNMKQAIIAYQKRQELENAVTNYYINKNQGKADPAKEATIEALKQQLGINEELLQDVLDQANQKLKQGDKEGACKDWNFIKNTGSDLADSYLAKYCK
ncbi:energy transducer TonB family protein [Mucilaginibacter terrae]|uniref:TonB family protein n=1 Tax=Mucilaginibacter terrae TaxID=1955052 RepID=A0ABU3GWT9_9SPHI|nr:energy transducer TonB [Mucilaginibacter terrae]MDT3403941.1 TonB family protein [Mucilaginibacter terrae]